MPRISPALIRRASETDKLLPLLLPVCRDISSARNELRWLREHVATRSHRNTVNHKTLFRYVKRRSNGEPLQYILGSEFFGDLELKCRPGVLIPRPETAAYVTFLVSLLSCGRIVNKKLRALDLCTGTGCIPLLFHHEFYLRAENRNTFLDIVGVDVSDVALRLARSNKTLQVKSARTLNAISHQSLNNMTIIKADILKPTQDNLSLDSPPNLFSALAKIEKRQNLSFDILISNPPYISARGYRSSTSRSVRRYEPKLALVPPSNHSISNEHDGDAFYTRLIDIAEGLDTQILLLEVGDFEQAQRVANLIALHGRWERIEIWRDQPNAKKLEKLEGKGIWLRGDGEGRSVFAYTTKAAQWIGNVS